MTVGIESFEVIEGHQLRIAVAVGNDRHLYMIPVTMIAERIAAGGDPRNVVDEVLNLPFPGEADKFALTEEQLSVVLQEVEDVKVQQAMGRDTGGDPGSNPDPDNGAVGQPNEPVRGRSSFSSVHSSRRRRVSSSE